MNISRQLILPVATARTSSKIQRGIHAHVYNSIALYMVSRAEAAVRAFKLRLKLQQ